jgi:hypothetical protein
MGMSGVLIRTQKSELGETRECNWGTVLKYYGAVAKMENKEMKVGDEWILRKL